LRKNGVARTDTVKRRFPQLAAIVISSESKTRTQKLKLPTDAFLQKGTFTHDQLIATIREILQQYKRHTPRRVPRKPVSPATKSKAGLRFSIQDDNFAGFRVRGLYDLEEQAWRVKTWPAGRFEPEHDYWVQEGDLYTVRVPALVLDQYWRRSGIGARNITVHPAERRAILHLVTKWKVSAVRDAGERQRKSS
jgi:hypothetical protein